MSTNRPIIAGNMEESLLTLLGGLAELLLEFLFEILAGEFVAFDIRLFRKLFAKSPAAKQALAIPGYLLLGVLFGFLSLLLFPHPLMHPTRFHGISLLISPILAGLFMSFMGWEIRRHGKKSVRIESFGYGFLFAFGMAIIRLVFAK